MEVPRNPSLTPDDIISRSWSQRPLTSRLASSPALPPAPRARAVPPPPPARESNVIDLTSDSPPLRTRALSQVAGDADPRQAKRQRVAEVPANSAVGPSRPARRPGATASATVVIDSDSDDDDDVIVVEPTPSGSGSWGAGGAAAGTSGSASLSEDEVVGPGGNAGPSRPRQRVARRATGSSPFLLARSLVNRYRSLRWNRSSSCPPLSAPLHRPSPRSQPLLRPQPHRRSPQPPLRPLPRILRLLLFGSSARPLRRSLPPFRRRRGLGARASASSEPGDPGRDEGRSSGAGGVLRVRWRGRTAGRDRFRRQSR